MKAQQKKVKNKLEIQQREIIPDFIRIAILTVSESSHQGLGKTFGKYSVTIIIGLL